MGQGHHVKLHVKNIHQTTNTQKFKQIQRTVFLLITAAMKFTSIKTMKVLLCLTGIAGIESTVGQASMELTCGGIQEMRYSN